MTKTPRFLLLALLAIVVSACEETVDITDAIYRERLVVESVLDAGDTLDILFTKTMPINQPYSKAAAALVDVTGTITAELGSVSQRYDLVHIGEGHYTAEGIALVPGARYTFVATWR